jgi:hypothetical protein
VIRSSASISEKDFVHKPTTTTPSSVRPTIEHNVNASDVVQLHPSTSSPPTPASFYAAMEGSNEILKQQPTAEDFNQPTAERVAILKRLEEAMGSVAPHFWAACQVCDIQKLDQFVEFARREGPELARIVAAQTQQ